MLNHLYGYAGTIETVIICVCKLMLGLDTEV